MGMKEQESGDSQLCLTESVDRTMKGGDKSAAGAKKSAGEVSYSKASVTPAPKASSLSEPHLLLFTQLIHLCKKDDK